MVVELCSCLCFRCILFCVSFVVYFYFVGLLFCSITSLSYLCLRGLAKVCVLGWGRKSRKLREVA